MAKFKKTPDIIQDEMSECGLACISYISGLFGQSLPLEKLRSQYDVNQDGLSFYHLMKISADYQMLANGVQVSAEHLCELTLPAVLLWDNCHFVVLKKVGIKRIEVMDPAVGSRFFTSEEVVRFFSGVALEFVPSEQFSLNDESQHSASQSSAEEEVFNSLKGFMRGVAKYQGYIVPLAMMALLIQLTNVAIPKFMSLAFDEVLPNNDQDFLLLLLYIFGGVYLVQALSSYLKILLAQRLRRAISQLEGLNTVDKLFKMPLKFFQKRTPADLLRKIRSVDAIHVMYTHGWVDIFIESLFMGIFALLLLYINFKLALIVLGLTLLMVLLRVFLVPTLMSIQHSAISAEIKRDSSLLESVSAISAIKINRSESRNISDWFSCHATLEANRSSIEKISALITLSNTTLSHIQTLMIMGMGTWGVLHGQGSLGQLISFIFYKNCLMENIQGVIEKHVQLKLCSVEIRRLADIVPPAVTDHPEQHFRLSFRQKSERLTHFAVRDLGFSYSNLDKPFLHGINFQLSSGEKLILNGPSGCGKTTLLNIISGLLSPSQGEILINDIELSRFGLAQYQQQISIVSPDDKIINGSVMDNIIYQSDRYDLTLLESSIEQANLTGVVRGLSAGLNTRLGVNGSRLSSGQHQRLMIARALYRQPALILLDEPTSHLDSEARDMIIRLIVTLPVCCIISTHDAALIEAIGHRVIIGGNSDGA